jgi:hypothetical protein
LIISTVLELILHSFGFASVGRLFGAVTLLLAAISFLQIPFKLFVSAIGNKFWAMNIIFIAVLILGYSMPLIWGIREVYQGSIICCFKKVQIHNRHKPTIPGTPTVAPTK